MILQDYIIARLLTSAINRHGKIYPTQDTKLLRDCITIEPSINGGMVYLWYNDKENSTHVIKMSFNEIKDVV